MWVLKGLSVAELVIVANEREENKCDESCGELVGKGMGFDVQLKSDV